MHFVMGGRPGATLSCAWGWDVPDFFFYEVSSARSYVTTGTSDGESWQVGPRRLAAELPRSISTAECCCTYNMLKLARKLYSWNPDPESYIKPAGKPFTFTTTGQQKDLTLVPINSLFDRRYSAYFRVT